MDFRMGDHPSHFSTDEVQSHRLSSHAWDELDIPRFSTFGQAAQKPERFTRWYYLDDNEELIVLPGDYAPPEEED